MQLYHAVLTDLDINEIRRYAGMGKDVNFPAELLQTASLEGQVLATPKASWELYPYDSHSATISSVPPLKLESDQLRKHLSRCSQVAVLTVTIGSKLEETAHKYFDEGNYTAGLLLEAAGTTAVEAAADQVCQIISQQALKQGLTTTWRFSPGYGNWDITVQARILALAAGDEIGVTVTPTSMLVPRKSITAIIGLRASQQDEQAQLCTTPSCQACTQNNCQFRKEHLKA